MHILGGNAQKVRLAFLAEFAFPGVPAIYYGDEIGLPGTGDPDCRRAFPWDKAQWNVEIRDWVKSLVTARKSTAALREGNFQQLVASATLSYCVFARTLGNQVVIAALNVEDEPVTAIIPTSSLKIAEGQVFHSLTDRKEEPVRNGQIQVVLNPYEGMLWTYDGGDNHD